MGPRHQAEAEAAGGDNRRGRGTRAWHQGVAPGRDRGGRESGGGGGGGECRGEDDDDEDEDDDVPRTSPPRFASAVRLDGRLASGAGALGALGRWGRWGC